MNHTKFALVALIFTLQACYKDVKSVSGKAKLYPVSAEKNSKSSEEKVHSSSNEDSVADSELSLNSVDGTATVSAKQVVGTSETKVKSSSTTAQEAKKTMTTPVESTQSNKSKTEAAAAKLSKEKTADQVVTAKTASTPVAQKETETSESTAQEAKKTMTTPVESTQSDKSKTEAAATKLSKEKTADQVVTAKTASTPVAQKETETSVPTAQEAKKTMTTPVGSTQSDKSKTEAAATKLSKEKTADQAVTAKTASTPVAQKETETSESTAQEAKKTMATPVESTQSNKSKTEAAAAKLSKEKTADQVVTAKTASTPVAQEETEKKSAAQSQLKEEVVEQLLSDLNSIKGLDEKLMLKDTNAFAGLNEDKYYSVGNKLDDNRNSEFFIDSLLEVKRIAKENVDFVEIETNYLRDDDVNALKEVGVIVKNEEDPTNISLIKYSTNGSIDLFYKDNSENSERLVRLRNGYNSLLHYVPGTKGVIEDENLKNRSQVIHNIVQEILSEELELQSMNLISNSENLTAMLLKADEHRVSLQSLEAIMREKNLSNEDMLVILKSTRKDFLDGSMDSDSKEFQENYQIIANAIKALSDEDKLAYDEYLKNHSVENDPYLKNLQIISSITRLKKLSNQ